MWPVLAQADPNAGGGLRETIDALARTPLSQIVIFVSICTVVRIALYNYLRGTAPHQRHGIYKVAKFFNEAMDAIIYAGVFVFMIIRPFFIQAFLIPSGSMLQTLQLNDFIVANKAIYRYSEPQIGDIIVFKPPRHALNKGQENVDYIKRLQGRPGDVVEVREGKLWRNGKPVVERYLSDTNDSGTVLSTGPETLMDTDWKLVHYTGTARPDLSGQYIPVQISRDAGEARYNYYGRGVAIAHPYAVGDNDPADAAESYVRNWKPTAMFTPKEWQFERELEKAPPAAIPPGHYLMLGDNRNHSYDGRAWGLITRDDIIGRSEFVWLPISRWHVTR